jgi:hypothetical protein
MGTVCNTDAGDLCAVLDSVTRRREDIIKIDLKEVGS